MLNYIHLISTSTTAYNVLLYYINQHNIMVVGDMRSFPENKDLSAEWFRTEDTANILITVCW